MKLRPLDPFANDRVELHSLTPWNGKVTERDFCNELSWWGLLGLSLPLPVTELVKVSQSPSRFAVSSVFCVRMAPVDPQDVTVARPFCFLPSSKSYQLKATESSVTGAPVSESTTFMFRVTELPHLTFRIPNAPDFPFFAGLPVWKVPSVVSTKSTFCPFTTAALL